MARTSIRRAQLIAPFGVGAMSTLVDGSSVITCGLDHWYKTNDSSNLNLDEFRLPEWRLQERLQVAELRLPPDGRTPQRGKVIPNVGLTVPALRFPRWCFCMYCKRLELTKLSMADRVYCPDESHKAGKRGPVMSQVPFVAICESGHLEDFPFREWVHSAQSPRCLGTLRLKSVGGSSLSGQRVSCDLCTKSRSLEGITQARLRDSGEAETTLSARLSPGEQYTCSGEMPWLAEVGVGCGSQVRGALRAAGNVYFPKVESSIFLPRAGTAVAPELRDLLRRADVYPKLELVAEIMGKVPADKIRTIAPHAVVSNYSDAELDLAVTELFGPSPNAGPQHPSDETLSRTSEWRMPEYLVLREALGDADLTVRPVEVPSKYSQHLDRVRRVDTLRETRALRGFTRVRDGNLKLSEGKALLRRNALPPSQDWLPAIVVKGEGIYLEFSEDSLESWEQRAEVHKRVGKMAGRLAGSRFGFDEDLTARFVLVHTFAHLLINELVFTCGYGSASLRERLYVSSSGEAPMAGVLIYTAAGDSEGTMGGLVRMAAAQNLEPILASAITRAEWCSTDPICMEVGEMGQGPDSCNMAACHGCSLLPETSCEHFNRFLDRGVVAGTLEDPTIGYFSSALSTS